MLVYFKWYLVISSQLSPNPFTPITFRYNKNNSLYSTYHGFVMSECYMESLVLYFDCLQYLHHHCLMFLLLHDWLQLFHWDWLLILVESGKMLAQISWHFLHLGYWWLDLEIFLMGRESPEVIDELAVGPPCENLLHVEARTRSGRSKTYMCSCYVVIIQHTLLVSKFVLCYICRLTVKILNGLTCIFFFLVQNTCTEQDDCTQ